MKKLTEIISNLLKDINFDGLRVIIKGDCSIRETVGALRRQEEISKNWETNIKK